MRTLPNEPSPGDKVSAGLISELIRAIRERTIIQGKGIRTSVGPNGTVVSAEENGNTPIADCEPFAFRYVEQDNAIGIPYTGWEIYIPDGCVTVNSTLTPMNPKAYRMESGSRKELDYWYRMPEGDIPQPPANPVLYVHVRAKCNAALYGIDLLENLPNHYLWAEVCEASAKSPGDTIDMIVGYVDYETEEDSITRKCHHTVRQPVFASSKTNGNFELVHSFELDDLELELKTMYVMNPSYTAGGALYQIEDFSEIAIDKEALYLKVDTENCVSELKTFNSTSGDLGYDEAKDSMGPFDLMILLYTFEDGAVVYDHRQNLNNIQVYKA